MCEHIIVETRSISALWVLQNFKQQKWPSNSPKVVGNHAIRYRPHMIYRARYIIQISCSISEILLFSPLGKLAGRAIYFTLRFFLFLYIIFLMISRRQIISRSTGPIFAIFTSNESILAVDDRSGPLFSISQRTLPWQPILCKKWKTPDFRHSGIQKRYGLSSCGWTH